MIRRVIVAGGGTGGHLFPGMAVVEELRRRTRGLEVTWVGTARGIESRVLPGLGEKLELLDVTPLKGQSAGNFLSSVGRLPAAVAGAMAILRKVRPELVIGVGGYASGPMLAAAAASGIPTAVLEQNAHVGLTNRMLARLVGRAYVTFPETAAQFGEHKTRVVGNPVRRAFVKAAERADADPVGFEARSRTVLVLGGSQGARALNHAVPEALARAGILERGLRIVHQTGRAMRDEVAASYRDLGIDADVVPFIDDMARAYANATVVISRAGATTLAELCAIGRPSILVPFPQAADDHQGKNAESLAASGAALSIREDVLTPGALADTVRMLLDDVNARRAMSDAARALGRPDAAAAIVDDLFEWLGWSGDAGRTDDEDDDGSFDETPPKSHSSHVSLRGSRPYVPRWQRRAELVSFAQRRPLLVDGHTWE